MNVEESPLHKTIEKGAMFGDMRKPGMDAWPEEKYDSITRADHIDSIYTSEPLAFIQSIPHAGRLVVNQSARDLLSRINKPLVIISVAGLYRTGKSFLMNRLFGHTGFSIGSSTEANTKGIWIWCRDHPLDDKLCLVVMDSEGLGDTEKEDGINQDAHVFALAVLLSSCIVYNSWNAIDENAIQNLSLVTQMTEFIRIDNLQEQSDDDTLDDTDSFFPSFVWVVRDFSLSLQIDHRPCTADDYLEHALKDKPGARNVEKNEVRKKIREFFPTRKCFTLKRPVIDEEKLSILDELPEDEFRPVFVQEMHRFVEYTLNTSLVKTVNDVKIHGTHLIFLADSYVNALNNGSTPSIPSIINHIIEAEFIREKEQITGEYKARMEERLTKPMSKTDLDLFNLELREKGMERFKKHKVLQKASNALEMESKLTDILWELRVFYERENKRKSKEFCANLMKELYEPINRRLNNEDYNVLGGYRMFLRDLARLDKAYQNAPNKGPMSDKIVSEFVTSLEGVKMLIRSGVEILSLELEREWETRQRNNYTVLIPWLKDSLVGSVGPFATLFGQAFKSVNVDSGKTAALPLEGSVEVKKRTTKQEK